MSSYGLYQTFSQDTKKFSSQEKKKLCERAKLLSNSDHLILARLIFEHWKDIEQSYPPSLPWGLEQTPNGISVDLNKLPVKLVSIIEKFITVAEKNENEKLEI